MSVRSAPTLDRRAFPAGGAGLALAASLPPRALEACHTTLVDNCIVEGHVPMKSLDKLLAERPAVQGISLLGMPMGSPWMAGAKMEPFTMYEISGNATPKVFAVE